MTLAVVLAGKGFPADGADKGPLVGVGAQVRAKVVGAREAFGAEVTLKRCWVLLDALVGAGSRGARGVGEFKDVITIGDRGGGGAAGGF